MKPMCQIRRGDVISRMFPHRLNLRYSATFMDYDLPLDEREPQEVNCILAEELPCSVQSAVAVNGQIIENEYIILSPCVDMSGKQNLPDLSSESIDLISPPSYTLDVTMNGKTNKAKDTEILSVDNMEVYNIGEYAVGCKIRVKVKGQNWTW